MKNTAIYEKPEVEIISLLPSPIICLSDGENEDTPGHGNEP